MCYNLRQVTFGAGQLPYLCNWVFSLSNNRNSDYPVSTAAEKRLDWSVDKHTHSAKHITFQRDMVLLCGRRWLWSHALHQWWPTVQDAACSICDNMWANASSLLHCLHSERVTALPQCCLHGWLCCHGNKVHVTSLVVHCNMGNLQTPNRWKQNGIP